METEVAQPILKTTPPYRFAGFKDDWELMRAGDLYANSRTKGSDGIPIYSVTIDRGLVRRDSLDRRIQNDANPENNLLLEPNYLAYNMMRMWQGAVGIALDQGMVSSAYVALKPKKTIHSPFAINLFNRARSIYDFTAFSYGLTSDRLRLYYQDFARIKFRIPTLPEQQKIAGFLSAVDARIQQLTRKKALLEQYKKGVMQQLFSQEIRFTRADGSAFAEWEEKRLGEVCSNISYGMNAAAVEYDGENKYLRITDIDENSREFLQNGLTSPGNELADKYLLREGDLLFARTGASVGKSYLYKKADGKTYFAGFLIRFHVKQGLAEFIYAQTLTHEYDRWVKENSMRSGQPGLNAEEYKSFMIHFPSLEEQQKIAGFLGALDARVQAVGVQLAGWQRWKKGLLQQMFV